jgi:cell division protein FtsA
MENYISAIEISDTKVRLAVGYFKDNKINLIHIAERPIRGLVNHGEIVDFQTLSSIILSMKEFKDETTKQRFTINEVTLVLPSYGLNIYQSTKATNVVSPYSLIATIDIENVVSLVQKEALPSGSEIVDIIPDSFILEKGRSFINPPINERSNNITIKAKIHTLPSRIVNDYRRVLEGARIKLRRLCVSSYALCELARYDSEIPQSYILVDIGAEITNVSLIGNCSPFETVSFMCGADDLISKVEEKFGLSYEDSLELLKKYGLDERPLTFKPVIATSVVNGLQTENDPESLNVIIKSFFKEEYFDKFNACYETLMKGYPDSVRNLPIVFCGGLTKMFGFEGLAKEKFESNASIHYLEPKCIGARDTTYSAVIGAMFASAHYRGSLSDIRMKSTNQLQREKTE